MKRDGRGGTEVSVKITCDEERRWFEIGAKKVHYRMNLDLKNQGEKREEWR